MKRANDTKKVDDFLDNSRDKVMFEDINNTVNKKDNNNINDSDNTINNINDNINNNKIAIIKKEKQEEIKFCGYRLPVSMIKKIDMLAKKSNMGKNEFVIKLLSETLDKIVIE